MHTPLWVFTAPPLIPLHTLGAYLHTPSNPAPDNRKNAPPLWQRCAFVSSFSTFANVNSPTQSKLINISKRIGQGLFLSNTETELFSKPFAGKQFRFVLSAPGMVRGQKGIKHIQKVSRSPKPIRPSGVAEGFFAQARRNPWFFFRSSCFFSQEAL